MTSLALRVEQPPNVSCDAEYPSVCVPPHWVPVRLHLNNPLSLGRRERPFAKAQDDNEEPIALPSPASGGDKRKGGSRTAPTRQNEKNPLLCHNLKDD
jgi:hypothetical protein